MPIFLPISPFTISVLLFTDCQPGPGFIIRISKGRCRAFYLSQSASGVYYPLSAISHLLDRHLDIYTGRQIQAHQRVNRCRVGI
ncbi:MAG TPA: hypothetical protein VI547_03420, partial [Anaerolineales bacterium]|nr:hypothetical protein [Anaerolineales bacterium]